jgi:GT2 family glycosyltransferase
MTELGIVVIGRNEGERLVRCLESVLSQGYPVVYIDSASCDGSADRARHLGVWTVELNNSQPYTAARSRNAGLAALAELRTPPRFIQFIDGDSELAAGWLTNGLVALREQSAVAAVCGRLRERECDASVFNRLCDMEWDGPTGEILACGGVAMMRVEALREVGGFNPSVIAAEDDELCIRLRLAGWKIVRLDSEMGLHDAAMRGLGQWSTRAMRAGHAFAQVGALHGHSSLRYFQREQLRVALWAGAVPILIGAAFVHFGVGALLLLGVYFLPIVRGYRAMRRRGRGYEDAWLYGVHCAASKFPQLVGLARYWGSHLRGRVHPLIEHK